MENTTQSTDATTTAGEPPKYKIKRLNPVKVMKPATNIYLVGKRQSGKTVLARDLLYHFHRRFDVMILMTPTPASRKLFAEFIPMSMIYDTFDEAAIIRIIDYLEYLDANNMPVPRVAIVLDDCMYDKKVLQCEAMRKLHYNGRHVHVCFINLVQYLMDIPRALRTQVDYIFCFKETHGGILEQLHQNFFSMIDAKDFPSVFNTLTEDNCCMVADRTSRSHAVEDQVYWYKAQFKVPPFIVGNRDIWKLDSLMYKSPYNAPPALASHNNNNGKRAPTKAAAVKKKASAPRIEMCDNDGGQR